MTVPHPRVVERKIRELASLSLDLRTASRAVLDPYNWAHGIGADSTVGGMGEGGSTQVDYSDPTLAAVTSSTKARYRAACSDAVRALDDAEGAVKQAIKLADAAAAGLSRLLPPPGAWSTVQAEQRSKELDQRLGRGKTEEGSFLSPGEYEQSVAAQRARGQGYGER